DTNKLYISNLMNSINNVPRFSISLPILINDVSKNDGINRTFSFNNTNNEFIPTINGFKKIFNGIIEASVRIDKLEKLLELTMLSSEQNEVTLLDRNE